VASYRVLLKRSATKELEALPLKDRRRVARRIQGLAGEPRPAGCEKLSGQEKFRLRQGDFRILYSVGDTRFEVTVVKIGHRRDVYR
jgi:mRNA interferase RelE/StbE